MGPLSLETFSKVSATRILLRFIFSLLFFVTLSIQIQKLSFFRKKISTTQNDKCKKTDTKACKRRSLMSLGGVLGGGCFGPWARPTTPTTHPLSPSILDLSYFFVFPAFLSYPDPYDQEISLHLTPLFAPDLRKRGGGQMGSASWDPFFDRFGEKSPLMSAKNPKIFAPAAQNFSVLPLEITKI